MSRFSPVPVWMLCLTQALMPTLNVLAAPDQVAAAGVTQPARSLYEQRMEALVRDFNADRTGFVERFDLYLLGASASDREFLKAQWRKGGDPRSITAAFTEGALRIAQGDVSHSFRALDPAHGRFEIDGKGVTLDRQARLPTLFGQVEKALAGRGTPKASLSDWLVPQAFAVGGDGGALIAGVLVVFGSLQSFRLSINDESEFRRLTFEMDGLLARCQEEAKVLKSAEKDPAVLSKEAKAFMTSFNRFLESYGKCEEMKAATVKEKQRREEICQKEAKVITCMIEKAEIAKAKLAELNAPGQNDKNVKQLPNATEENPGKGSSGGAVLK